MGSSRREASSISTVSELRRFTTARRRYCLRQTKSSGSMRCTCNAGASSKEAGRCACARCTSAHRLETLLTQCSARYPHLQAAVPLLRAAGIGRRLRLRKERRLRVPESSRALRLLRPRVVVLLAQELLLLPGSVACASSAAAPAVLCAPAQMAVRRRAAQVACASASSTRASWLSAGTPCAECILHAAC
jgi:hypothetical protein